MNIDNIQHVTDPEVDTQPSQAISGFPTEQELDQALVETGIEAAEMEARGRAREDQLPADPPEAG